VREDFSPLTFDGTVDFASGMKKATIARDMVSKAFSCFFQETPRIVWISQKERSGLKHLYCQFSWRQPKLFPD